MSKYILALDQGTTSSRAIVFDREGGIVAVAQKEFRQIFPRPGWVEHDPNEIWSSQIEVANEATARAGGAANIAAIGIANQRETAVVWNRKTGAPIHNAIVWQDRRTADYCEELKAAGHEPKFSAKTGLLLDAYFSGTKVRWLLDHVPDARAQANRGELAFGTIDSWLIWRLTNGARHITDATNASRTLLFNIHTCQWDEELLEILDVPKSILPEVRSSSEKYAATAAGVLPATIPIAGIGGDQQAATFGQAAVNRGMAKNTYGTGCFMLLNIGAKPIPSRHKLLTTIAWKIGDRIDYALEGSVFVGGAVVQWLRDGLNFFKDSREVQALASSVPDSGGVFLVPAFVGLGAPYWDPYARGTIVGLTRGTTRAHIARAALDSIALQSAELLEAMHQDSGLDLSEMRVDGGACRDDLLMQIQADVLGVPVVRPRITETTALGAAYLAGLAVGFWSSVEEIGRQWQMERRFAPACSADERAAKLAAWRRAVERSRNWENPLPSS
jgi:glycerol kinase